ncbi:MAG: hypothetical protein ACK4N5_02065 [Myxococcales bacterium]
MSRTPTTLVAVLLTFACAPAGTQGPSDAGEGDAGRVEDAGRADAGTAEARDAGEPLECSFNSDCASELRCECDEDTGCYCLVGPRGTGAPGSVCTSGNDCESALCVEDTQGGHRCSTPCDTAADCPPELKRCADITFVGRICIREPPPRDGGR